MGRVMAIDYGRKRCGVAVTDTLRISANGLPTQRTCDLLAFIKDYCPREGVDLIVVGLPRTMSGEDSESARYIEPFLARLRKEMPGMPVERFDERFTSALAMQAMIAGGVKRSDRQRKELHDKTAAVIILTDWLQSRQNIL
ncbi:MAG: Holliday junction resolvase RuvX [Muribaculaceae bacterium]|nr:Holliday junction resolvase RuvX [Bacteroidales bacterium]MBD5339333.1 Holliday junction resolvase RuvX [Bacteroides sp.]MDE7509407.1 Holliday junction resolvase RuvX [Muribaculaceae bacterium]